MRPRTLFGPADAAASDPRVDEAARRAATAAQIAADLVEVEALRLDGFEGPDYDAFANRMARHGYRVMTGWTINRHIFAECAARALYLKPLDWSEDERASLVQDTLATGYRRFHQNGLCAGTWTPEGGASLRTFFIGGLVYAFKDEYTTWYTDQVARRRAQRELVPAMGAVLSDRAQRVGAGVIDRDTIRFGLAQLGAIDPRLPKILALDAEDYTHNEIATLLGDGTSPKAIEGIIRRHRLRLEGKGRR